jgi:hypothetical protein
MQVHADVLGESYEGTLEIRPMFDGTQCGSHAVEQSSVSLERA